ncbi:glutamate-1-semialdehyde 2,1-aminomutase [Candidatus Chlamydia sanziniae]|uniref:Glutamate-1-semialdehyde 2,1-aminomutase n=1 Tax=Candidatus Chlamydia sanziniae TaxID=1806891 RepID=A0A1A9HV93_9CHLA|nr:glutamate-1-semialdehyde 2,1-aminomutase [Candidatus Chlamydia sanziniae]ANH78920.1 Glutamate-1-semialdehyde aminotransferase [Candidatus Chlamydia sanziniae]
MNATYAKACELFPGGVNSPVRACRSVGITPPIVVSANRDVFWDCEGREFIDFCGSWGALIHGHSHPRIVKAICLAASKGSSYGLTSIQEIAFATDLLSFLGLAQHKVRFVSSGTEAAMTAVRLARGITHRPIIIKFTGAYHGHADSLLGGVSITSENLDSLTMILQQEIMDSMLLTLPYNDLEVFCGVMECVGERVAGVIFEPICANMGVVLPKPGFLEVIIEKCCHFGSLSIMDEVVTGFRLGFGGARDTLKHTADITIYGKILGGGTPVAAVVAHKEVLDHLMPDGMVFQAGTLSGNALAMAAGYASIHLCREENFYNSLQHLADVFYCPIEEAISTQGLPVSLVYQGSMFSLFFAGTAPQNFNEVKASDEQKFQEFYREIFNNNVYLSPSPLEVNFISAVHTEEHLIYAQGVILDTLIKVFHGVSSQRSL